MALNPCWQQFARIWDAVQVELHGKYSVERVQNFKRYADSTSSVRTAVLLLLTPLPGLLAVVIPDLIPLEPPERGLSHSHMLWVRSFIAGWIIAYCTVEQCRHFIVQLPITTAQILVMPLFNAAGTVAWTIGWAHWVGYPVPFMFVVCGPCSCTIMVCALAVLWREHFVESPEFKKKTLAFGFTIGSQMSLAYAYLAYMYAFEKLSGWPQAAFAVLLPVIKIATKKAMSYLIRNQEDRRPEFVIFNAEVFHALFVATCLQGSKSLAMTSVFIVADFLHACLSLGDIYKIMKRIRKSLNQVDACNHQTVVNPMPGTRVFPPKRLNYVDAAIFLFDSHPTLYQDASIRLFSMPPQINLVARVSPPPRAIQIVRQQQNSDGRSTSEWKPDEASTSVAVKPVSTHSVIHKTNKVTRMRESRLVKPNASLQ